MSGAIVLTPLLWMWADRRPQIGDHRLNCGDVGAYIAKHYEVDEVDVRLRPDRSVKYDEMAKVLASLQSSRIVRVGFVNYRPGT